MGFERIWTIGHSTHSAEAFQALLAAHDIRAVVDVRRFPGSRRHPQFSREALAAALPVLGVDYHWFEDLGGRRRARPDSHNTNWRNPQFRGYADYMETAEFARAIERLQPIAAARRTVLMCAELLWWRCHRALISDYLKACGVEVLHVSDMQPAAVHPYTSAARVVDGRLSYSDDAPRSGSFEFPE